MDREGRKKVCPPRDSRTLAPASAHDALATALIWLGPELQIRDANARGRELLARVDAERLERPLRLSRGVGAETTALAPDEATAVRRFLGGPREPGRRTRVRFRGLVLDVGVGPWHGARGEWLGWAIDAAAPVAEPEAPRLGILGALPFPAILVSPDLRIVETSAAAAEGLASFAARHPQGLAGLRGERLSAVMHAASGWTSIEEAPPRLRGALGVTAGEWSVVLLRDAHGSTTGALLAFARLAAPAAAPVTAVAEPDSVAADLERELEALVADAMATAFEAEALAAEETSRDLVMAR